VVAASFFMPYSIDDNDLPNKVKEMPQHDKEIWVAAFNDSYESCIGDGGKEDDCESSAYAIVYSAVKKSKEDSATRMSQFRDNDYPEGQLCPYNDCCHDLAIPTIGWYKCGACERVFYAGDTDSDYEDYRCYREDKAPADAPAKPDEIPTARDLGASWATPEEESREPRRESRMKVTLRNFVNRLLGRAIKDVESWDGAASNYASTDSYCAACLIDSNAAAGRDTKDQAHCMLPVKLDGETEMVKQAVYAAAGGHGITQVVKPEDVPKEDWDAAVKAAANKIISAYDEMEEEAPEAVYELAGKEKPTGEAETEEEQRAKSIDEAFWDLSEQVYKMDGYAWLNGAFVDEGKMFAIISAVGKLYRAEITIAGDKLMVGERESWFEVKLDFPPIVTQSRTTIQRQQDGRYRWFSISCSAVLNRAGEIDSRALFDSFIAHAEEKKEYPIREFFHAGEKFRTGQCDYLARDDYLLITSGLYDDTEIGRAEVKARQESPDYWGDSIGFLPTQEPAKIRVAEGVDILAYDEGILQEISTLPEAMAAAWFTATPTIQEVNRMLSTKQKEELVKLMGSVEVVDKWLDENSATRNREIADAGMVTRAQEPPVVEPETEAPQEFVLEEAALVELTKRVGDGLDARITAAVTEAIKGFPAEIEKLSGVVSVLAAAIDQRLKPLEADEDVKHQIYLQDAPKIVLSKTVRPRNPDPKAENEPESMADQAEAILANIPQWGPKSK